MALFTMVSSCSRICIMPLMVVRVGSTCSPIVMQQAGESWDFRPIAVVRHLFGYYSEYASKQRETGDEISPLFETK